MVENKTGCSICSAFRTGSTLSSCFHSIILDLLDTKLLEPVLRFPAAFFQLFGEMIVGKCSIREYCIAGVVTERVADCYCIPWIRASVTEVTPHFGIKTRFRSLRLADQSVRWDNLVSAPKLPKVRDNLKRMGAIGGLVEQIPLRKPVSEYTGEISHPSVDVERNYSCNCDSLRYFYFRCCVRSFDIDAETAFSATESWYG